MKVNSVSSINNFQSVKKSPSFSSNYYKQMMEIIPNTKVSKNLRKIDQAAFKGYITSKIFKMGITADEVNALDKFEGLDFIKNSYDFLISKMGLKESFCPPLAPTKFAANDMGYAFIENVIYYDVDKVNTLSKGQLFAALRHEMQHMNQNYMILRHEKLGPKAMNAFTKKYIKETKNVINNLIKNNSPEKLKNTFGKSENPHSQLLYLIITATRNGDSELCNKLLYSVGENYKQTLSTLRTALINEMGVIKSDSALTKKVESYFNDFTNIGYYKSNGNIDYNKYFSSFIESEAISAQTMALCEYSKAPCGMKFLKDVILDTLNDSEQLKIIEDIKKQESKK